MTAVMNGFNKVAWLYDPLAKIVFGDQLHRAQLRYLKNIPRNANILIVGGGTGALLKELLAVNTSCRIWYVEASSAMIKRAKLKTKKIQQAKIHFIHGTENSIPNTITFDVVITNFFLDLFSPQKLTSVTAHIHRSLRRGGLWLVSDFTDQKKKWQQFLLGVMYKFFRFTCGIEAQGLPPWEANLARTGLVEWKRSFFLGGFVKSAVWMKRGS